MFWNKNIKDKKLKNPIQSNLTNQSIICHIPSTVQRSISLKISAPSLLHLLLLLMAAFFSPMILACVSFNRSQKHHQLWSFSPWASSSPLWCPFLAPNIRRRHLCWAKKSLTMTTGRTFGAQASLMGRCKLCHFDCYYYYYYYWL